MAMADGLLRCIVSSLKRPPPPPGLLHRSPEDVQHLRSCRLAKSRQQSHSKKKKKKKRAGNGRQQSKAAPRRRGTLRALANVLSIASCVWSASAAALLEKKRRWTNTFIAVNLLIHGADMATNRLLSLLGAKINELIRIGQIWRLATSSLLHGGLVHIVLNSLSLNDVGPKVEQVAGPRRFLAIYWTSAVSGSLMSYYFCPSPSIGASDAICGLTGAQIVYTWRHRAHLRDAKETLVVIAFKVFVNLVIGILLRHRIDNWAHLGGLLGGAAAEWFLGQDCKQRVANPKDGMVVPLVQPVNSSTKRPCKKKRKRNGTKIPHTNAPARPLTTKLIDWLVYCRVQITALSRWTV